MLLASPRNGRRRRRRCVASTVQPGRQVAPGEPDRDGQVERAGRQVVGEAGVDPDVGEVDRLGRVQVDRAGDAAVPPLVLVLDVGRVGPLDDRAAGACWRRVGAGRSGRTPRRGGSPCRRRSRSPLRVDDEDALGGPDVEDDPSARPSRPGARTRARRRRSGSGPGWPAGVPRTASGRSCSGACPRSRPSSRRSGRPPRTSRRRRRRRASDSSWNRHRPSSGSRSAWSTLCMGRRPIPVSSGWFHGRVIRPIVAQGVVQRTGRRPGFRMV